MSKPKNWDNMDRKEKSAWFAGGRISTGKLTEYNAGSRKFSDWHVGKVRGLVVTDPETGQYKFKTAIRAQKAALAFLRMCSLDAI